MQLGHLFRTAHNMTVRFSSLNALRASISINPQSSYWVCSSQRMRIAWMAPSIPASTPPAICVVLQAAFASGPATCSRHLAINLRQVSPTPTGLIPGFLSRSITQPLTSALYAFHGGCPFPNHSTKSPTINRSSPLAAPNRRSQCWSNTKSVPPGPAPPKSRPATAATVSSVISTGVSSRGRSVYDSRLAAVGVQAYGCLARSTSITRSPVFVQLSPGWRNPPVSRSVIYRTVVRSFPRSTRLW